MSNETSTHRTGYGYFVLRGAAIALITWLIKLLASILIIAIYTTSFANSDIDTHWAIYLIIAVGDIFIFNSTVHLFSLYDRRVMKDFLKTQKENVRLRTEIPKILRTEGYFAETISLLIMSLLIILFGGFNEFSLVFRDTGAPLWLMELIKYALPLPLFLLFNTLARYEARRRWFWLSHTDNLKTLYSIPMLILRGLAIFFLYVFVFPFAPIVIFAYAGIFGTVVALIDLLTVMGFIIAVLALVLLIFGILALNALRLRHRLLKRLKKLAFDNDYTLSEIKRPYASLFVWQANECSFTLTRGKKVFSCRLIGSFWQRAPMFFTSNKHAYYRHRLGTKNHHITLRSQFEYDFEGEGDKILILNPVPKNAFAASSTYTENPWYGHDNLTEKSLSTKKHADAERRLEPGDRIWGYAIYNTTAFLGAIDRQCLGRYNGMFE